MNLDAANTAIVLDSTADFPEGPERFPNWRIVPLYVRFGAESFADYVELGPDEFYERLRTASASIAIAADTVRVSTTRTCGPPSMPAAVSALANVPDSVDEICSERIRS